jgi:site-specific recombinase XerC
MPRPRTGGIRVARLAAGRVAYYARFSDQYGKRREECVGYDLTDAQAEAELQARLEAVSEETYVPPERREPNQAASLDSFLDLTSDWLNEQGVEWDDDGRFVAFADRVRPPREGYGLSESTQRDLFWRCQNHLRPFFRDYQPREIDARLIDRYRNDRLAAGLSASSINKTINTLAAILDLAEDYALLGERGNPAHGKRRKAKETKVERDRRRLRSWADYDPLMVLLEAARDLDKNSSRYPNLGRLPMIATYFLAGPRTTELTLADRRDLDLLRATLDIGRKTPAGLRGVFLVPYLLDIVAEWFERSPFQDPSMPLYPTYAGNRRNGNNVRSRIFRPCIRRAQQILTEAHNAGKPRLRPDGTPVELPKRIVPYSGRRTAVSFMVEAGWDIGTIQEQIGHTDSHLTMSIYRQRRHRPKDPRVVALMKDPRVLAT